MPCTACGQVIGQAGGVVVMNGLKAVLVLAGHDILVQQVLDRASLGNDDQLATDSAALGGFVQHARDLVHALAFHLDASSLWT